MAKQFYFCFIRLEDISPKSTIFVPMCIVVWLFLWQLWSSGLFLAERPFKLCRYMTNFTVDIDTFVPVPSSIFIRSFAVVLGLICSFLTNVHYSLGTDRVAFLSGMMAAWSHAVYTCVLLFVQMDMVPSGIWKLLPKMNQTCWGLLVFLKFWLISFDFPMMSSKEALCEGRPGNTLPIATNYVNFPIWSC